MTGESMHTQAPGFRSFPLIACLGLALVLGGADDRAIGDGPSPAAAQPTATSAPAAAPFTAPSTAPSATRSTAPSTAPAAHLDLLLMGDWGEGKPAQTKVAGALAAYAAQTRPPIDALLTAGDNFYVPISGVDDPTWQTLFEKMYDPARLNFPFYIALGNHDYDQKKYVWELAYAVRHPESRWKFPRRWYRLDLPEKSPLVTILMLDSDHDFMSAADWNDQLKFIADELSRPRAAWTLCVAHHPIFSNGPIPINGVLQQQWAALFQKHKVDFYLCGHEHNLQHIEVPGWFSSFVLAGGGGAHKHPMVHDNHGPFSRSIYGFVHLEFTPETADVKFLDSDGKRVHEFSRSRGGQVNTIMTTPSDAGLAKPLEAIQGLYDRIKPDTTDPAFPQTRPAPTPPATQPAPR